MSNTLTLLDRTPDWIEALCREIDTLKFASAFDTFTPDAILAFGVKQITGAVPIGDGATSDQVKQHRNESLRDSLKCGYW